MIAGGVESMSRAPFVMPKAESAFSRSNAVYDTTIGWRFVNKLMKAQYGVDSMPETAENVATDFGSSARRRTAWRWLASEGVAAQKPASSPRDRAGDDAAEEGRPDRRAPTSIRARPAWRRWPSSRAWCARRHGDRRQRQRRERRRLRAAAGQRGRPRATA
jgi:hypothetical protein